MSVRFWKYHGTGNDFILVDARDADFRPDEKTVAGMCDRRLGIGADGLIVLRSVSGYDFRMQYFNSDGRESTMCGNGGRCVTALADFLSPGRDSFRFLAADGPHDGVILGREDTITQVRITLSEVKEIRAWHQGYVLNTGSPHLVIFQQEDADVAVEGRRLRHHPDFAPEGINVNFVRREDAGIFVRTYERGVEDETLSCGTGVTASALAFARMTDLTEGHITIGTRGGRLKVGFVLHGPGFGDIWLEGPADRVFEGVFQHKISK